MNKVGNKCLASYFSEALHLADVAYSRVNEVINNERTRSNWITLVRSFRDLYASSLRHCYNLRYCDNFQVPASLYERYRRHEDNMICVDNAIKSYLRVNPALEKEPTLGLPLSEDLSF